MECEQLKMRKSSFLLTVLFSLDDWKLNGTTQNGQFIDLPSIGAKVGQKDIFIQVDYFADSTHSHVPTAAALKLVHDAFQAQGITLHIDAGPDSVMICPSTKWTNRFSKAQKYPET